MEKVKLLLLNPFKDLTSFEHRPMQEARFFKEMGCEVEVIILQRKITGNKVYTNKINGIDTKHFLCKTERMERMLTDSRIVRLLKPIIYLQWYFAFILWLRKELRKEDGCCILGHNIEMAVAMVLASKRKRDKRVFVMRELYEGQVTNRFSKEIRKLVSGWLQDCSDYLVQVVPYQRKVTKKRNIKKIIYIPNYPEFENYKDVVKTESQKLRIDYIGCVRDEKSLQMLMDAAKGFCDVEIGIHGDGDAYEYLNTIKDAYDNVSVTGYYDYRSETGKLFSQTDIVYCAYDLAVENWRIAYPIKMYESIAVNIPVMLCRGMAPVKFVEEHNFGFVFDYNVNSLRKTIDAIRKDKSILEEMSEQMKLHGNKYLWENVVGNYKKILMD